MPTRNPANLDPDTDSYSQELNIVLEHPFGTITSRTQPLSSSTRYLDYCLPEAHLPDKRIEITGMPNRPGSIKVTERSGPQMERMVVHEGGIDRYAFPSLQDVRLSPRFKMFKVD